MNRSSFSESLDETIRIAAGIGAPAIILICAMSTAGAAGLAGGAALAAALSMLGGPAGIYGGVLSLTVVGVLSAALASHGLEILLAAIYARRIQSSDDPEIINVCVKEINNNWLLSGAQRKLLISTITKRFSILVVGRTGTGKSSTINSLLVCRPGNNS